MKVVSNDPKNPKTTLHVEAQVKFDAGYEDFSLDLGNVLRNRQTIHDVAIDINRSKSIKVSEITSSSEFISARVVEPADTTKPPDSIHIAIAVGPCLESGLLSEKVVVNFKDSLRARVDYYLYGIIVAAIEVPPLSLT